MVAALANVRLNDAYLHCPREVVGEDYDAYDFYDHDYDGDGDLCCFGYDLRIQQQL